NATDIVMPTYFSVFGRFRFEYQIKSFSDLDGMRIGYKKAARPTRSLLEKLPSAVLKPYDSHETMTQDLLSKEIDVIVAWMSFDHWRKEKLQGTIDNILLIDEYPIEMVTYIRNDWPELIPILNKTLVALQQDDLPRIINKWFGEWPKSHIVTKVRLTLKEQAWLRENPHIRLATLTNQPPFSMMDANSNHTGMLAEILALLSKAIGQQIEPRLVENAVSDTHAVAKQNGISGSASILKTSRHANEYLLTDPYYMTPYYIYTTTANRNEIRRPADLKGKRVAVPRNHRAVEGYLAGIGGVQMVFVDTPLEQMRMVIGGETDALIGYFTYPYLVNKYLMVDLAMAFVAKSDQGIHIGVNPEHPVLHGILNKAIASLDANIINAIAAKWTKASRKEAARVNLTKEEKAWLDQEHTVRVRIADWPPYMILKDDRPPHGIVIEYLNLIGERTGIRFKHEVTNQPFAEFLDKMKQRQGPDMTAVIVPTPEREQYLSFSKTYIASPYVIFTREQDNPILDISGLAGKTLAVPRGFVVQQQLDKDYPEIRQALYDSDEAALQAVATGQAGAYIGNLTVASYIIHGRGFSHLRVAAGSPFGDQSLSMGNRNDWPELTSIINKALASITEKEKTAIRNKYLAIKFEQGINKAEMLKWVLIVGGSALSILLIFVFWNRQMSREISKRKQTELALKQARDEAETANQAKSLFLANMSHELRTPLNAILGFSGMLTREQNASTDQQEKLTIINRSGQHLLSMINDVLDLSKIEAGRFELQEHSFDLVALIKEISVMIQSRAAEKEISITVEAESISFPYVKADKGKLRQMLINLLNNAVKFTGEGGVTIRCDIEPIPQEPNRCQIVIEVEDTGPGIEPARQEQIFEPFVQGFDEPVRKGTGLGLSICKKYAEFMGGTIELESEVGKGSLFRLRLPAEIFEAVDVSTPVEDKPRVIGLAPTQKTSRILVADDNRANLLLLKSLLEVVGFFVLEAKNGKEAVEAFKKESPDFIWMDMRMPVMDGYEATRRIRSLPNGETVKIVAITASAFNEQRPDILAAGCNDTVTKPFQAREIFETMGRFLDIEYIYETESEAATARMREVELTAEMLADLPDELLQELREAAQALNREAALEVIARIAAHAPEVTTGLKELVDNFQMAELQDFLRISGTEHA
ncbi:MAG: transporter substrate-binding domain-containing protein, partial [Desulfobacterales bacterium]